MSFASLSSPTVSGDAQVEFASRVRYATTFADPDRSRSYLALSETNPLHDSMP